MQDRLNRLVGLLPKKASDDEFDFDAYLQEPLAATPAAPVKPSPPDISKIKPIPPTAVETKPTTVEPPKETDLPSWVKPEYLKSIQKMKLQKGFSTSHWLKPESIQPGTSVESPTTVEPPSWWTPGLKPSSKRVKAIPEIPKAEPSIPTTSEEAKSYLASLPQKKELTEALKTVDVVETILGLGRSVGDKKSVIKAMNILFGHLFGLRDHAKYLFDNDPNAIAAIEVIIKHFDSIVRELGPAYVKAIMPAEERKQQRLHELTSKYLSPKIRFINNRTIRLARDSNITNDQAEKIAQNEWDEINAFVDQNPEITQEDREKLKEIGVQDLLAGRDLENAKKTVTVYSDGVKSGAISLNNLSNVDKLFPNVHVDPSELEELASFLLEHSETYISIKLEQFSYLLQPIQDLAKTALQFAKAEDAPESEEKEFALQQLYDKVQEITTKIFVVNTKHFENPDLYELLSDVYAVWSSVTAAGQKSGLESIHTITTSESAAAGLGIDLNSPKTPTTGISEIDIQMNKKRKRNPELARKHREQYEGRVQESGMAAQRLENARQRQNDRSQEDKDLEKKMDEIRNPDYPKNKREAAQWKYWSTLDLDEADLSKKVKKIIEQQKDRTEEIYERMSRSTLPQDVLDYVENGLVNTRIRNFKEALSEIEQGRGHDPDVIKAMKLMIEDIPSYFEEAKEKVERKKTSVAWFALEMAETFRKEASRLSEAV